MTSVIGGKFKGRKLFDVKNLHVRPTQAKLRKSIFQILEPFEGLDVLDLYAGVGTLGIEAMSRGASRVVFVEKNRRVFKVLQKNIGLFEPENSKLILMDVQKYLVQVKNQLFDIVLADPPYSEVSFSSVKEMAEHFLKPGGIFCMEMKKESIEDTNVRVKHYGSTQVVFWRSAA
jgi:16S rRNA (guanine966-N2)-methyltransferase